VVRTIKNKSGVQKPLIKTGRNRKAKRVGKFKKNKMENQNSSSVQQAVSIKVSLTDNIARMRSLIPALFALVVILFLFNFGNLIINNPNECLSTGIVGQLKGINLITGTVLDLSYEGHDDERIPSKSWAIIAFGAAIIGLGVFLIKEKRVSLIGTCAGAIGFGSLLLLQFDNTIKLIDVWKSLFMGDFDFAYWGALIAMGIASFISYLRMRKIHKDTLPKEEDKISQKVVV